MLCSFAQSLPQCINCRGKIHLSEKPIEKTALVEGELTQWISRSAVKDPAQLHASGWIKELSLGLWLGELMTSRQVCASAHSNSNDRLNAISIGLGYELAILGLPALKIGRNLCLKLFAKVADNRLNLEALLDFALEVIDLRGRLARAAEAMMQKQVESLKHSALTRILRAKNYGARSRSEGEILNSSEALDGHMANLHRDGAT